MSILRGSDEPTANGTSASGDTRHQRPREFSVYRRRLFGVARAGGGHRHGVGSRPGLYLNNESMSHSPRIRRLRGPGPFQPVRLKSLAPNLRRNTTVRLTIASLWCSSLAQVTPHPAPSADGLVKAPAAGHPLPSEAVSELAKSRFLERIINNLRCAKVQNI